MVTMQHAIQTRINQLCEEKEINSILTLCKKSDLSQSTLNELMQGRTKHPSVLTIKKISNGLNITLSDFFDDPIFNKVTL